jgi:hypothetical protein
LCHRELAATKAMAMTTPLDTKSLDQLRALGFEIGDDKRMALIQGDVTVSVSPYPDRPELLVLTITVPKGPILPAVMRREDLLDALEITRVAREKPKP